MDHEPDRSVGTLSAGDGRRRRRDRGDDDRAAPASTRRPRAAAVLATIVGAAWKVRSSGRASTVGSDQFATFHEMVQRADLICTEALVHNPTDPSLWAASLDPARGLGLGSVRGRVSLPAGQAVLSPGPNGAVELSTVPLPEVVRLVGAGRQLRRDMSARVATRFARCDGNPRCAHRASPAPAVQGCPAVSEEGPHADALEEKQDAALGVFLCGLTRLTLGKLSAEDLEVVRTRRISALQRGDAERHLLIGHAIDLLLGPPRTVERPSDRGAGTRHAGRDRRAGPSSVRHRSAPGPGRPAG